MGYVIKRDRWVKNKYKLYPSVGRVEIKGYGNSF